MGKKLIAVIGAGVMGSDIALDLSIHHHKVLLKDLSRDILESAMIRIKNSYRFTKIMKKSSVPSLVKILKNIITTVDSSIAMQLVNFIEETFHIQIADEDLDLVNFSSINRMVKFIDNKKSPGP